MFDLDDSFLSPICDEGSITGTIGSIIGVVNTVGNIVGALNKKDSTPPQPAQPMVIEKPVVVPQPVIQPMQSQASPSQPIKINLTVNFYADPDDDKPRFTFTRSTDG